MNYGLKCAVSAGCRVTSTVIIFPGPSCALKANLTELRLKYHRLKDMPTATKHCTKVIKTFLHWLFSC